MSIAAMPNRRLRRSLLLADRYTSAKKTTKRRSLSWFQSKVDTTISPNPLRVTAWPDVANLSVLSSLTTINLPVGHPDNPFSANGQGARLYYVPVDIGVQFVSPTVYPHVTAMLALPEVWAAYWPVCRAEADTFALGTAQGRAGQKFTVTIPAGRKPTWAWAWSRNGRGDGCRGKVVQVP